MNCLMLWKKHEITFHSIAETTDKAFPVSRYNSIARYEHLVLHTNILSMLLVRKLVHYQQQFQVHSTILLKATTKELKTAKTSLVGRRHRNFFSSK